MTTDDSDAESGPDGTETAYDGAEYERYRQQRATITASRRLCDYTPFREYVLERLREVRAAHEDAIDDDQGAIEEVYINFDSYTAGDSNRELAEADPAWKVTDVAGYTASIRCAVHEDLPDDFLDDWSSDVSQALLEI